MDAAATEGDATIEAVRRLVDGGAPVPPELAATLLEALDTARSTGTPAAPSVERAADRLAIADGWD
jgi:hypothetical protein